MNSTTDVEVPELYSRSAAIWLWVEDSLTRDYLRAAWGNPVDVAFRIAGRSDAVEPILHDAVAGSQRNVFGVVDRDFGATNYEDWTAPNKTFRRFILPVHELENLLLDSDALAGCSLNIQGRDAGGIEERMRAVARKQRWWMACRSVIAEIRERFFADFMEHPRLNKITAQSAAEKHILESAWFGQLKARTGQTMKLAQIKQRLAAAHQHYDKLLNGQEWKKEYSGKEVFRAVRGWIYTPPPPPPSPAASVQDSDLARSLAEWQLQTGKVPQPATALLQALRQRVAAI